MAATYQIADGPRIEKTMDRDGFRLLAAQLDWDTKTVELLLKRGYLPKRPVLIGRFEVTIRA